MAESCTKSTFVKEGWTPSGKNHLRIIDTPGLNDCEGEDNKLIYQMISALKKYDRANAFFIVCNG